MSRDQLQPHWQYLLERLSRVASAMDEAHGQSAARTRELLDARAQQMAAAAQRDSSSEPGVEVVTFSIGRQRCGISTSFVFEVLDLPPCTLLPGVPPHFLGLCSLRGQILLVADLALLFDFAPAPESDQTQLLILGTERPDLGVLARGTCQTALLPAETIAEAPDLAALPIGNCAQGITTDGLVLLDGRMLLSDSRLFINQGGDERPT